MHVTLFEASPSLRLALRRWLHSRGHEVTLGNGDGLGDCDVVLVGSGGVDEEVRQDVHRRQFHLVEVPWADPVDENMTVDFHRLDRTLNDLPTRDRQFAIRIDLDEAPLKNALVTRSDGMRSLLTRVQRLARVDIPVLINGETGSGKELVARALHDLGPRADEPFVAVHCGAIPEELLESILFGHERGSFTDAVRRHHGHLEAAGRGTVLLDEIGEMPIRLQAKLLRVLQQKCFHRVGGTEEIPLRARILAATHRNLSAEAQQGEFRSDLLHRIAGAILVVPPLRQRRADIPVLVHQFLDAAARSMRLAVDGITPSGLRLLEEQPWPGNVRQLQNVLHRAVVLGESSVLDFQHLRGHLDSSGAELAAQDHFEGALEGWVSFKRRSGWSDPEIREELHRRLDAAMGAAGPGQADLFGAEKTLPPARAAESE